MAKLVSKVYGDALFELGIEEDCLEELSKEAEALGDILYNKDLVQFMEHPEIMTEKKIEAMGNILRGRYSDYMIGFLSLVVRKGRYGALEAILDYFLYRVREHLGIGTANVITAVPLDHKWKSQVKKKLLKTTHYRKLNIDYGVDSSLIGGMIIRIGDRVIDSSIKSRIAHMQSTLMGLSLE